MLQEFSCDVSMEGGIYRDGQERQEFSFTLYDFDGHGKITKDVSISINIVTNKVIISKMLELYVQYFLK